MRDREDDPRRSHQRRVARRPAGDHCSTGSAATASRQSRRSHAVPARRRRGLARNSRDDESLDFEDPVRRPQRSGRPHGQTSSGGGVGKQRRPRASGNATSSCCFRPAASATTSASSSRTGRPPRSTTSARTPSTTCSRSASLSPAASSPATSSSTRAEARCRRSWRTDWDRQLRELGLRPRQHRRDRRRARGHRRHVRRPPRERSTSCSPRHREGGYYDELRQVPADLVKRYFGQFVPPGKIRRARELRCRCARQGLRHVNNILYASLIYSNPGYVPANLAGNIDPRRPPPRAAAGSELRRAGQFIAQAPTAAASPGSERGQWRGGSAATGGRGGLRRPSTLVNRARTSPQGSPRGRPYRRHRAPRRRVHA